VLAGIWQELLHVERVGRHDNFFELGGHSLLVLRALARITEAVRSTLNIGDLYKHPTIESLAMRLSGQRSEDELVDLTREAVLDSALGRGPATIRVPAKAILLTGASGFVGRYLLSQLLHDTEAKIYCLVRAQSEQAGASKLRAALQKWDLWHDDFARRIVAVPGDLARRALGVDCASYDTLVDSVDRVYHCATSMNHLETYAAAKAANVGGAKELLKLASLGEPKLVNYVSTLGIFTACFPRTTRIVNEETPIESEEHWHSLGYLASKWVGEKLFLLARERGVPCNVFRLGLVWADSERGRFDELQYVYRLMKSCLLAGCAIRNYSYDMPPTPVDYVARSIVLLGERHSGGGGNFHISSSQNVQGVFERCNQIMGAGLQLLSPYAWLGEMKRLHRAGHSLPVVPLIEYAFSMDEASFNDSLRSAPFKRIQFDCRRSHQELHRYGLTAPVVNDTMLERCLNDMVARDPDLRLSYTHTAGLRSGGRRAEGI
jgi:thioester reductase-like protein